MVGPNKNKRRKIEEISSETNNDIDEMDQLEFVHQILASIKNLNITINPETLFHDWSKNQDDPTIKQVKDHLNEFFEKGELNKLSNEDISLLSILANGTSTRKTVTNDKEVKTLDMDISRSKRDEAKEILIQYSVNTPRPENWIDTTGMIIRPMIIGRFTKMGKPIDGLTSRSIFAQYYEEHGANNNLIEATLIGRDCIKILLRSHQDRLKVFDEIKKITLTDLTLNFNIPTLSNPRMHFYTSKIINETNHQEMMTKIRKWNKLTNNYEMEWISSENLGTNINKITLSMNGQLRAEIERLDGKLSLGTQKVHLFDSLRYVNCSRCYSWTHRSNSCSVANRRGCSCGGPCSGSSCDNINDKSKFKCLNCKLPFFTLHYSCKFLHDAIRPEIEKVNFLYKNIILDKLKSS